MNKILLSASQLATSLICGFKFLQNVLSRQNKVEVSSAAMDLGSEVHRVIKSSICNEPIKEISPEASEILLTPSPIVEGIIYKKCKKVVQFESNLNEKENLLKLEKEYGRAKLFSEDSAVVYCDDGDPISLIDIFHHKMFGKPLTRFEYKFEVDLNKDFSISGVCDALSEDGSLIVDWKTANATPKKSSSNQVPSLQYFNYMAQLGMYRILYCKQLNIPISPCDIILAYIVKNKIPKFYPVAYKLTEAFLSFVEKKMYKCLEDIQKYFTTQIPPDATFGDHCDYCLYKEKCLDYHKICPDLIPVTSIRTEYINI